MSNKCYGICERLPITTRQSPLNVSMGYINYDTHVACFICGYTLEIKFASNVCVCCKHTYRKKDRHRNNLDFDISNKPKIMS